MNIDKYIRIFTPTNETLFSAGLKILLDRSGKYITDTGSLGNIMQLTSLPLPDSVWIIIWTENDACFILDSIQQLRSMGVQLPILIIAQTTINTGQLKQLINYRRLGITSVDISASELENYMAALQSKDTGYILSPDLEEVLLALALNHIREAAILFTRKEHQIIDLVRQGYTIRDIAASLGLSKNTVAAYRGKMFRKTGTKSINQLMAKYNKQVFNDK